VFHPLVEYPLNDKLPVFDSTVTVAPSLYEALSVGTAPDAAPLGSYLTLYVDWPVGDLQQSSSMQKEKATT
jgi:hypothetical protein